MTELARVTQPQYFQICRWVETLVSEDPTVKIPLAKLCAKCGKALDLTVSKSTMRSAVDTVGATTILSAARVSNRTATNRNVILAKIVKELFDTLGETSFENGKDMKEALEHMSSCKSVPSTNKFFVGG